MMGPVTRAQSTRLQVSDQLGKKLPSLAHLVLDYAYPEVQPEYAEACYCSSASCRRDQCAGLCCTEKTSRGCAFVAVKPTASQSPLTSHQMMMPQLLLLSCLVR
jgi:hypothetical protein